MFPWRSAGGPVHCLPVLAMRAHRTDDDPDVVGARLMREDGYSLIEIAETFGVSRPTVHRWVDPRGLSWDRERSLAWKKRQKQPCRKCGVLLAWDSGEHYCRSCFDGFARAERMEWVVRALRWWNETHDRPPGAMQWSTTAERERAGALVVFEGRRLPYTSEVLRDFGSWNAAIRAAGLRPLKVGGKRSDRKVEAA